MNEPFLLKQDDLLIVDIWRRLLIALNNDFDYFIISNCVIFFQVIALLPNIE